jgi:uncharacterized protein
MTINEMAGEECSALLIRTSVGRLGCSLHDQPYVLPIFFAYEDGYIYVFSTLGQKVEWMRSNPKVCVQVDEIADQSHWVSVIANGRYEEISQDSPGYAHARQLLEKQRRWWLNALAERRSKEEDLSIDPLFFRIQVDSMTGLQANDEETC